VVIGLQTLKFFDRKFLKKHAQFAPSVVEFFQVVFSESQAGKN
jgi:hypothetical protein